VVISHTGFILTSGHVVAGADKIIVTTSTGEEFKARVVGNDEPTDIAVLKVDATNLPSASLADSSHLRVGDIVLAIGNPFGVGETVTSGIVSGTDRDGFGISDFEDFIQTDASINPGNSGGALVDAQGHVVGISIAILSSGGGFEGIGLAVPINLARNVMSQLIARGRVVRGYLGATLHPVTPRMGQNSHVSLGKGALVTELAPDSPAAQAGMKAQDVIVEYNGRPVTNDHELRMRLAQATPGTRVHIRVRRQGSTHNLKVVLGEMPARPAKVAANENQLETGFETEP
jgi:serine protease Do